MNFLFWETIVTIVAILAIGVLFPKKISSVVRCFDFGPSTALDQLDGWGLATGDWRLGIGVSPRFMAIALRAAAEKALRVWTHPTDEREWLTLRPSRGAILTVHYVSSRAFLAA